MEETQIPELFHKELPMNYEHLLKSVKWIKMNFYHGKLLKFRGTSQGAGRSLTNIFCMLTYTTV